MADDGYAREEETFEEEEVDETVSTRYAALPDIQLCIQSQP